jgi:hypothetical protein
MKKFSFLIIIALTSQSHSATTLVARNTTTTGRVISDSNGNAISGVVRVGFFNADTSLSSVQSILRGTDYNAINSIFTPIGEGGASTGVVDPQTSFSVGSDGRFALQINNIPDSYLPYNSSVTQLNQRQLFMWVLNNSNFSSSTSWALVTDSDNESWRVNDPSLDPTLTQTYNNTNITNTSDSVYRGSAAVNGQLRLAPVPEPTTLASVLLGGLALLRRRRVS